MTAADEAILNFKPPSLGSLRLWLTLARVWQLIWKERLGFVRLAAAFGYTIVPFASLGADESLQIVLDAGDLMNTPLGKLLRASGLAKQYLRDGEELPPLVLGLGLTWLPRPEKFCVSFGHPISTSRYRRQTNDVEAMRELRGKVASSIESQLAQLQHARRETKSEGAATRRVPAAWDELVAGFETQVDRVKRQ